MASTLKTKIGLPTVISLLRLVRAIYGTFSTVPSVSAGRLPC